MPSMKADTHIFSQPVYSIGINSRCKYKQKAFEYAKLLLSENYQSGREFQNAPVNKKAYEETAYFYISNLNNKLDLSDSTNEIN